MDISKCKGTNCALKDNCYRYLAESNEIHQSYLIDVPFENDKCEFFWEMNDKLPKTEKEEWEQFNKIMEQMFNIKN